MRRSGRKLALAMALMGAFVYGLIWSYELAARHWFFEEQGPSLRFWLSPANGFALLGVLAALLIAVHLSLWNPGAVERTDGSQDERAARLDTFAFGCGAGAVAAAMSVLSCEVGNWEVTGGTLGVGLAATLVVLLAADASEAVERDLIRRHARRLSERRRDQLRAVVDDLGSEGPSRLSAVLWVASAVVVAAAIDLLVAAVFDGTDALTVGDGVALAVGVAFLVASSSTVAILWWDREQWWNLFIGIPIGFSCLTYGVVFTIGSPGSAAELTLRFAAASVGPLFVSFLDLRRKDGALRSLVAVWFRWHLRRAEAAVDDTGSS